MKKSLIYLASPYSHPDPAVMRRRFEEAVRACAHIHNEYHTPVISPIVLHHPMVVNFALPRGWDYWETVDLRILQPCTHFLTLCIPGWDYSVGVKAEWKAASSAEKRMCFLKPLDREQYRLTSIHGETIVKFT